MQKRASTVIFALIILLLFLPVIIVNAQEGQPTDDEVNAIAKKIYCPVCENTPLDECGTQACIDWRAEIRRMLSEGWSEEEIIQYFVDRHGAQILAKPPLEGFYLLIYIIPPVILIAGVFILIRAIRGWGKHVPIESSNLQPVEQDEYLTRMEEELRRHRGDA
jgi:cytochrome c-type biogenesis protein CcmH